jgi:general stress protein 26
MLNTKDTNQKIQHLHQLIQDIECTMLTTVDDDGSLHSRPMSLINNMDEDGRLWFFTSTDSHKVLEIKRRQQVNVSFCSPEKQCYISITGTAEMVKDRNIIVEKWQPELQTWFPQGIDEPNIALLKVTINKADYWESLASFAPQTINFLEKVHH